MASNSNVTKEEYAMKYPTCIEFMDIDPECLNRGLDPSTRIQITKDNTGKDLTTFRWLTLPKSCTGHSDMFLLEDEKLIMPGDKFETHDQFQQYVNENSKRWNYYYSCHHSYQPSTEHETYTYRCVYSGKNYNRTVENRVRKRDNSKRTNCPCTIKLKRLPFETEITAIYVCNHHNHEVSPEEFLKLQHGRRLPLHIKEEIVDFILLDVDRTKIRKYVQMETGLDFCAKFFYNIKRTLERNQNTREITEERLKILNEKIAAVEHLVPIKKQVYTTKPRKKYPRVKRKAKYSEEVQPVDDSDVNELSNQIDEGSPACEIQTNPWAIDDNAVLENHEADDLDENNIEYMQCDNEYMEECIKDVESPAIGDDVDPQTNEHHLEGTVEEAEYDLSVNAEATPDIDDTQDPDELFSDTNKCIQTAVDGISRGLESPTRIQNTKDNTVKDSTTFRCLLSPRSCTGHSDMFLLEDEKLIMPGDKFETHDQFQQYVNENSKRWNFYYSCHNSYQSYTEQESYIYRCVYSRKNYNRTAENRVRKRDNSKRTNCPCVVKLRRLPLETEITAIYVCNHHNHEVSPEQFLKLQHGRRLPLHIKEEIVDLILLDVDRTKIRKYVQMETGLDFTAKFFHNIKCTLERNKTSKHITGERLKILNEKIAAVEHLVPVKKQAHTTKHRKKYSRVERKAKNSKGAQSIDESDENELNTQIDERSSACEIQTNPWAIDDNVVLEDHEADDLDENSFEYMQCNKKYMTKCANDIKSPVAGDDVASESNECYLESTAEKAKYNLSINTEQTPDTDDTQDSNELSNDTNKCIQTAVDGVSSDNEDTQNEIIDNVQHSNMQIVDMYKKYDYVDKHNISQYLTMPGFSDYINVLAKNTGMNVLDMLTNVYNDVAQLRVIKKQTMTSCKIVLRYRKQTGKSKEVKSQNNDEHKKEKLGNKLRKILILKEKISKMKESNNDLIKENSVYKNSLLGFMTSELD